MSIVLNAYVAPKLRINADSAFSFYLCRIREILGIIQTICCASIRYLQEREFKFMKNSENCRLLDKFVYPKLFIVINAFTQYWFCWKNVSIFIFKQWNFVFTCRVMTKSYQNTSFCVKTNYRTKFQQPCYISKPIIMRYLFFLITIFQEKFFTKFSWPNFFKWSNKT